MSEAATIKWGSFSGKEYTYGIYPIGKTFKDIPGNYIFAKQTKPGYWFPCYIGQTENLNQRLGDHEKEACAKSKGATHVHVHVNQGGEKVRRAEERDLILKWQPACNDQYVA